MRAALIDAGISAVVADAWVAEVGSPATFAFELEFDAISFVHRQRVSGGRMEVDEDGRFELVGDRLSLIVGDPGSLDIQVLRVSLSGDSLRLRWLSSTDSGPAKEKEIHDRYTIAFYCSAEFVRQ